MAGKINSVGEVKVMKDGKEIGVARKVVTKAGRTVVDISLDSGQSVSVDLPSNPSLVESGYGSTGLVQPQFPIQFGYPPPVFGSGPVNPTLGSGLVLTPFGASGSVVDYLNESQLMGTSAFQGSHLSLGDRITNLQCRLECQERLISNLLGLLIKDDSGRGLVLALVDNNRDNHLLCVFADYLADKGLQTASDVVRAIK